MQFHDKTAYAWGLRYRWNPSLLMNLVRRFAHFMPPWAALLSKGTITKPVRHFLFFFIFSFTDVVEKWRFEINYSKQENRWHGFERMCFFLSCLLFLPRLKTCGVIIKWRKDFHCLHCRLFDKLSILSRYPHMQRSSSRCASLSSFRILPWCLIITTPA